MVSASLRERKLRSAAESLESAAREERSRAMADGLRHVVEIRSGGFIEQSRKKTRKIFEAPRGVEVHVRLPGRQWRSRRDRLGVFANRPGDAALGAPERGKIVDRTRFRSAHRPRGRGTICVLAILDFEGA